MKKLDNQCEHRCIVGCYQFFDDSGLIYDGVKNIHVDAKSVTLFNFCPGCGQELDVSISKTKLGFIVGRKQSE